MTTIHSDATPAIALDKPGTPPPALRAPHTPGIIHDLSEGEGALTIFQSTQPDFGLKFTASLTWFTTGDPQPALSFYMEQDGIQFWQFDTPDEPARLAGRARDLEQWLDDLGTVARWAQTAYPGIPTIRFDHNPYTD